MNNQARHVPAEAGFTVMQKTKPFNPAQYLTAAEAQTELLNDALATSNAAYIANALGVIARARGMTEVAKEAGITREALYKSLSEDGDPRLTTLMGVARALGFKLVAEPVA
jgi:probable addiction module antidote protein